MHQLVILAKRAIDEYVKNKNIINPPEEMIDEMKENAGVFVSLKKNDQLRGCIGTFVPTTDNVAKEIINNAISSATEDPRFSQVEPEEIDDINISVDVLSPPEKVDDLTYLDPKQYGIIITKGFRKGLLLPNLEGVDSIEEQIRITKLKAGIEIDDNDVEILRFKVKRYY